MLRKFKFYWSFHGLVISDKISTKIRLSLKRGFGGYGHGLGRYDGLGGLGGLSGLGGFGGFDGLGGLEGFGGFSGFGRFVF